MNEQYQIQVIISAKEHFPVPAWLLPYIYIYGNWYDSSNVCDAGVNLICSNLENNNNKKKIKRNDEKLK